MKARYSQSRSENESGISVSSDALLKARHASSRKTRVDVTEGEKGRGERKKKEERKGGGSEISRHICRWDRENQGLLPRR